MLRSLPFYRISTLEERRCFNAGMPHGAAFVQQPWRRKSPLHSRGVRVSSTDDAKGVKEIDAVPRTGVPISI
jgi:hypothetical protein